MTARAPGNMVPYGKVTGLPRILVKKVNLANPLGGIKSADLFRPPALAYEDGYADGREYGPTGKFVSATYDEASVPQYAAGFKAGCQVREHLISLTNQFIQDQEASVVSAAIQETSR